MAPRRILGIGVATVVVLLLLVAVLWPSLRGDTALPSPSLNPRRPPEPAAERLARGDADAAAPATTPSPTAVPQASAEPTPGDLGDLLDEPKMASVARLAADEYRQRARFPRFSQPLVDGDDPILRERQVSPIHGRGEGGAEPVLTVFPEQVSFEDPEPVRLYAFLSVGGERVPANAILGELQTADLVPLGPVVFRDDGAGGDGVAGDALYSAVFDLAENLRAELSASYLVRVQALTMEGEERAAATGILYSSPHAKLTGRFRDRRDGGDLLIEAEVEVRADGRFHLEGSLYSSSERPIAWAQAAMELPPGRHWLGLRYFGLVLHESGIDGPYVLRYAALSTTSQMPNAKNNLAENAHVTAAYAAAEFSDAPFDDPDLLDAADRLEGQAGGG
jgi:hypothetical protein